MTLVNGKWINSFIAEPHKYHAHRTYTGRRITKKHTRGKWVNAFAAASRKYRQTHSLAKSRKAARMQIFRNVRRLFGASGKRMI
jgi:hypothetical protein